MRVLALTICAASLAACSAGLEPKVSYVTVDRPVAVSCVPAGAATAAPKVHTPADLAKVPDGPTLFVMTASDYAALHAWMLTADPLLRNCATAAPPPH